MLLPFRGLIRYPISPLTPSKIQKYVEEVQWYLKWSHWGRRDCFGLGVALPVALIQFNHGLKVAELICLETNCPMPLNISPPYTQAEVDSIEETLNLQLALKAEFDQIESQAAEQGWIYRVQCPVSRSGTASSKVAELAFNAQVKPMVQVIEQELGITIDPPYGRGTILTLDAQNRSYSDRNCGAMGWQCGNHRKVF